MSGPAAGGSAPADAPVFVNMQLDAWISALGRLSARNPAMAKILHIVDRMQDRPYRSHALLLGEPGTGKEGLARLVHRLMHPEGAPCERVFLRGRSDDDIERLVFGGGEHGPGALSRARGGTLIIDELLALSPALQRRLHEAISRQRFTARQEAVAVFAMTDETLTDAMIGTTLRHDLYYKLARLLLWVPPLRERHDDIAHSAVWMANRVLRDHGDDRPAELLDDAVDLDPPTGPCYRIAQEAIAALRDHRAGWPGNFRELEAVIERAIFLYSDGQILTGADIERALGDSNR